MSQNSTRTPVQRFSSTQPGQNPVPVEGGEDPGYQYYYSESQMTKSDGIVMIEAVYQYEQSANQNVLSFTIGGVTITLDLNTQEALPISDDDQQRLEAWGASEDATLVRDTSVAIIDQGAQQPFEVVQNYYAIAILLDTIPGTAMGPRMNSPAKSALHHAISKLNAPSNTLSKPCSEPMITSVNAVATKATTTPLMATVVPQCFGCCGVGCHCITDRYGAAIYGTPCANHDSCVGQYGYVGSPCWGKLAKAVLYTWYRNTRWGAYFYYQ